MEIRGCAAVLVVLFLCADANGARAQVNVTTYHYDNARTGQNVNETILTPANVNAATFGKLFTYSVDGYVYAQPLYLSNVQIPNKGSHNVVFVATEHDSVYAFDADSAAAGQLWHVSFIDPPNSVTTVPATDVQAIDIQPEIGITSTPVIDATSGTIYVVAKTKEVRQGSVHYVQRLHALDVATGGEKFGGPAVIADTIVASDGSYVFVSGPTVPGNGDGSVDGQHVTFNAFRHLNRPGLLLLNGVVYSAWGSHGDQSPSHGWVIGHDAQTLVQVSVFNTTPNGGLGAIWSSGGGAAADADGNIYVSTGNGTFATAGTASPAYGDSVIKLAPGGALVTSYFTPNNEQILNDSDLDLGSGGVVLLPDQPGNHPRLLVTGGKDGTVYLLDRDDLGGFRRCGMTCDDVVEVLPAGTVGGNVFDTPAYFNGRIYYQGCCGNVLKAFALSNGVLSTTPVAQSTTAFAYPGATPSVSANGSSNGVVWTIERSSSGPAVLHAHDVSNLANELYNSDQTSVDRLDSAVKFTVPTIVNGKVYVGTRTGLAVLGLLSSPRLVITSQPQNVTAPASGTATFSVSATGTAPLAYQWRFNGAPIAGATSSSYTIANAQASNAGTYDVVVSNSAGSVTSNPATLTVTGPAGAFTNGSFESNFTGWTVTGNAQVVVGGTDGYSVTDGTRAVAFNGANRPPNGVVAQTFATTAGQAYTLRFDVGAISYVTQDTQRLQVTVQRATTLLSQTITVAAPGNGTTWLPQSFGFTADGATATLTFSDVSLVTDNVDLMLDNVRVTTTTTSAGVLQFNAASYSVAENGGSATITVMRTGGSAGAVGVSFATSNGTAGSGDYTAVTQTVTFAAGDTANKTVSIPIQNDMLVEGSETVNLTLSGPTGGASLGSPATAVLTITDDDVTNNPVPTITSLAPSSATAGGPGFTLAVNGTIFVSGAVIRWNGTARTTTFVSATQLTTSITTTDIATAGTIPVTVVNPAPGGGTSNAVSFAINAGFTLTVTRSGNGMVTSNPPGIQCSGDCTETYNSGTTVTLTATPSRNFVFIGWGGDCSGTGACTITMNANKTVSATFRNR